VSKTTPRQTESGGTVRSWRQALSLIEMGAPMHPIFVHFTIALTAASLAFDALGFLFNAASLIAAGFWSLNGAAVMTFFTLASGMVSSMRVPVEEGAARSFLRAHMALGPAFFGLLIGITIWRMTLWQGGRGVSWWYLGALGLCALVMTAQGYLGGELVYRYGVEVEQAYRELPQREAASSIPSAAPRRPSTPTASSQGTGGRS
jgi:uncharacterized membrane protein